MMGSCCGKAVLPGSTICSLLNSEAFEIDVSLIITVGSCKNEANCES